MGEHILLIAVGPVQGFIASARRSRDLWFGSWLMSELARYTAESVKRHGGSVTLIFPPEALVQSTPSPLANVANKILARISASPPDVMKKVEAEVKKHLMKLWEEARTRFPGRIDDESAKAQIADLLECYWVAVALPSEQSYAQVRRRAEALMAARKTTRDFARVTWGKHVPKSSIDGQRESVIAEENYPRPTGVDREQKIDALYRNYKAGAAERLSGVDLLKRHGVSGNTTQSFPSTADIAVRPIMSRLEHLSRTNEKWRSFPRLRWTEFIDKVEPLTGGKIRDERVSREHPVIGHFDGGLLLESRLYELIDSPAKREQAQRALASFFHDLNLPRPEPYYAILIADGDRMGAAIDQQQTMSAHLELSRRLGTFANLARDIVTEHEGALIYAGGDDVMAFIPLHRLIACARALNEHFRTTINPSGSNIPFTDGDNNQPTLSIGIAICHQIDPLGDSLELARAAERTAKQVDGKNALAITLSKRSGADVTISGKWGELDQDLDAFVTMHRTDSLPDGVAFQLRDMVQRLIPVRSVPTLPDEATYHEAERIIGRKQPDHGRMSQLAEQTRQQLSVALKRMYVKVPTQVGAQQDPRTALARVGAFADALIVARILATAADLADPPYPSDDQTGGVEGTAPEVIA